MGADSPVLVFGFGRSGTTWVSDILSKCLGKIILFEPFHPAVYDDARSACYAPSPDKISALKLKKHYEQISSGKVPDRWLLRNHLPSPLDTVSGEFVHYIWRHTKVGGFKSIRQNFALSWWKGTLDAHVFFVVRHPLAVISSIIRRPRFFEEFGWDFHWTSFIASADKHFETSLGISRLADNCRTLEEKIAFMWAVTHVVVLRQLSFTDHIPVYYEALYEDPFTETKKWLSRLDEDRDLHPSYFFTPSMLTLKTSHPFSSRDQMARLPDLFWAKHLSQVQIVDINRVIRKFVSVDERFASMIRDRDYLYTP